jgi:thymidylate kinase
VLYLDAPLETLLARVAHRGARPDCIDEQAERILQAREDYQLLRRAGTAFGLPAIEWHSIDASGSPQQTCDQAAALLEAILQTGDEPSLSSAQR